LTEGAAGPMGATGALDVGDQDVDGVSPEAGDDAGDVLAAGAVAAAGAARLAGPAEGTWVAAVAAVAAVVAVAEEAEEAGVAEAAGVAATAVAGEVAGGIGESDALVDVAAYVESEEGAFTAGLGLPSFAMRARRSGISS
jgi:hypothetical protein